MVGRFLCTRQEHTAQESRDNPHASRREIPVPSDGPTNDRWSRCTPACPSKPCMRGRCKGPNIQARTCQARQNLPLRGEAEFDSIMLPRFLSREDRRLGLAVIIIQPGAAATDPKIFCHQLPPRRFGRIGTVVCGRCRERVTKEQVHTRTPGIHVG